MNKYIITIVALNKSQMKVELFTNFIARFEQFDKNIETEIILNIFWKTEKWNVLTTFIEDHRCVFT